MLNIVHVLGSFHAREGRTLCHLSFLSFPTRSCQVRTVKRENGREERMVKLHVKFVCVYLACLFKSQSVRLYARNSSEAAKGLLSYNQAKTADTT